MIKLKNRANGSLKKVMIYGLDGSGKSTFCEKYCKEHKLNAVVIDVDDTNYTNLPIVEISFENDVKTVNNLKNFIKEVKTSEYDTIVLDGVTSLLELLTSNSKGRSAYSDRSKRWNKIINQLLNCGKHLIFIGQADMEVIYTEEARSNKAVIKVNSIVNEKYRTYIEKGEYKYETVKYRTYKGEPVKTGKSSSNSSFETADKEQVNTNPVHLNYCRTLKKKLEKEGKNVSKGSMKMQLFRCIKDKEISEELKQPLIDFINNNCPEELK